MTSLKAAENIIVVSCARSRVLFVLSRMANPMDEDPPIDDAPDDQKSPRSSDQASSFAEHTISSSAQNPQATAGKKRKGEPSNQLQASVISHSESKEWSEAQKVCSMHIRVVVNIEP